MHRQAVIGIRESIGGARDHVRKIQRRVIQNDWSVVKNNKVTRLGGSGSQLWMRIAKRTTLPHDRIRPPIDVSCLLLLFARNQITSFAIIIHHQHTHAQGGGRDMPGNNDNMMIVIIIIFTSLLAHSSRF